MMDPIDPRKRSLPGKKEHKPLTSTLPPRHKRGEEFLKGPIPWNWLCRAAELCGKAFQVAIAIWFLAGVHKREVEVSGQAVEDLGVSRYACYRGLKLLEKAGLKGYLVFMDLISPERLETLGMDAAVITACPRLVLDDSHLYKKPILTPLEVEVLLEKRKDLIFEEME